VHPYAYARRRDAKSSLVANEAEARQTLLTPVEAALRLRLAKQTPCPLALRGQRTALRPALEQSHRLPRPGARALARRPGCGLNGRGGPARPQDRYVSYLEYTEPGYWRRAAQGSRAMPMAVNTSVDDRIRRHFVSRSGRTDQLRPNALAEHARTDQSGASPGVLNRIAPADRTRPCAMGSSHLYGEDSVLARLVAAMECDRIVYGAQDRA
jgi:hypothetical protein